MWDLIREHRDKLGMLGLLPLGIGIGMLFLSTSIDAGRANLGLMLIVMGTAMVVPLVVLGGKEVMVTTEIFTTDYKTPMLKFPEFLEQLRAIEEKVKAPVSLQQNVTKKAAKVIGLKVMAKNRVVAYVTINAEGEYVVTSAQEKVLDTIGAFDSKPYTNGHDHENGYMGYLQNTVKPGTIPH